MTGREQQSYAPFSCFECKSRKVKCDRITPICIRCTKDGAECRYPTERRRPVQHQARVSAKPRLRELEIRLHELEDELKRKEGRTPSTDESASGFGLMPTGRFEQLPPQGLVDKLTNLYFSTLWPENPMVHPGRYLTSLYQPPHMRPPMCLQYIIMAGAANVSVEHKSLAEPFYRRSRRYIEADEMGNDGYQVTVAHCQTWVLIGEFEAQNLWFSRASMSTARAVRLSQLLGLHVVDAASEMNRAIPMPVDWCQAEERRRTFWATFLFDRGASITGTWPTLINATRIQTRLPSSNEAFKNGIEEPSLMLDQALNDHSGRPWPIFACRVIAMHLLSECFDVGVTQRMNPNAAVGDELESMLFWNRYESLSSSLEAAFSSLPYNMRCPENAHDANAVSTSMLLHTATISIHFAGGARALTEGKALPDSRRKVTEAAQQIVTTVALATDIDARFRNPFFVFAAYTAATVFHKDYIQFREAQSLQKLTALFDVMISAGMKNPGFPALLVVQLARELETTAVDPLAMSKVRPIIESGDMSQQALTLDGNDSHTVVICPVRHYLDNKDGSLMDERTPNDDEDFNAEANIA
ncbi:Fungal trans [Geosmithia morbida]|uniref:Fungal trans n=1 Tax=Geosmithia morbida TaxID=1094350 RepID=A0A9P4YTJ2_9HYPO|nr:Fungal trans [Geosmithia morbida]KAF4120749.1 Fungal trans [Geosmithia morbida]